MRNKILIIILVLALLVTGGIIYLNKIILPTKIKSLLVNNLQEMTQKKVSLESVRFNIFKGLVLKNLVIYDDEKILLGLKEGAFRFLIIPIFKKQVIIPSMQLKSASMLLVRRKDNTFNIQDLFAKKVSLGTKPKFSVSIFRITVRDAGIHFRDETFSVPFTKDIENLGFNLYLNLPARVRFNLNSQISAQVPLQIKAAGSYEIVEKSLTAKISLQNFAPGEFISYYQNIGIDITEGLSDAQIELKSKDNILYAGLAAQSKNLSVSREKIQARMNSQINANLQYNLKDKQVDFSGKADITEGEVQGLEFVDRIGNINGQLSFTKSDVSCDSLNVDIWGVPITAKFTLSNFNRPLVNINIISPLDMGSLQGILKEKFKLVFPGQIEGQGRLSLTLEALLPLRWPLQIKGYLDILDTAVKLEKLVSPIENINGRLELVQNQLKWQDVSFKYLDTPYKSTGLLTDFRAPKVQLALNSQDVILETNFSIYRTIINFSRFSGKYFNSDFSLAGKVDTKDPFNLAMDISGDSDINLQDLKDSIKKFKDKLEQISPQGKVRVQFNLNGNLSDFKSCIINAKLSSPSLSVYGLKSYNFLMNYNQSEGIINIPLMHYSLYDGTIEANVKMNLNSINPPYVINADIQNIKIEKLKLDTKVKEKDISGTLQAQVKLNGFLNDISKLKGTGKINISEGRLWQLNLFKGLGSLLFTKDFANIIFHEGSCAFLVQDQYVFTDNLRLKSNITDLFGSVKIGFDSSINASLNVQDSGGAVAEEAVRFGTIKINGTLSEPRYKFQPAVMDIIKGLKEAIFGQ